MTVFVGGSCCRIIQQFRRDARAGGCFVPSKSLGDLQLFSAEFRECGCLSFIGVFGIFGG